MKKMTEPIQFQAQILKKQKSYQQHQSTINRQIQLTTTQTELKKLNERRSNQMCLTSSTRHAESLTNSSLEANSPHIDFSPLVNEDTQALRGLVDIFKNKTKLKKAKKRQAASKVMHRRWEENVKKCLPPIDIADLPKAYVKGFDYPRDRKESPSNLEKKGQFAPEYSNKIYQEALEHEYAIGNFFTEEECHLDITEEARFTMVQLIEQINHMKSYREETLFLAVNIADRYLALLAVLHNQTPSLIELGVISIMLAAKLNEHLSPSYYNIVKIINSQQKKKLLCRKKLLAIERQVLTALSFDI